MLVQNFDTLGSTPERKIVLEILNAGLESIQPQKVIKENITFQNNILKLKDQSFDLSNYYNVFLIGFGKGAAGISKQIENILGDTLTAGYVIDTTPETFSKLEFTQGTHPLPSEVNFQFTEKIVQVMHNLSDKDLVLVVICGGGSAMLVSPIQGVTLDEKINTNKTLLKSGADIKEMNTVRKHLSRVKGGGLAKLLYPSRVVSLIFSDVPGNDLSFIASGPTVKDETTIQNAIDIIKKYNLENELSSITKKLKETPKDEKYFQNVLNILILSNLTALNSMQKKAQEYGMEAKIYSDHFQSETGSAATTLIENSSPKSILLAGGETTVKVTGNGKGGRNQEVILASLNILSNDVTIASVASDGFDNTENAGAIGDASSLQKGLTQNLDPNLYLTHNDSYTFFEKTGDGIKTGRLPSNVSDLFIVLRK